MTYEHPQAFVNDGPCEEDGPWAEGWEVRSGMTNDDRIAQNTRPLNLIDDHRRLQLQHQVDDPAVLCALLHVQGRKVAFATADLGRCRFSWDSDGEVLFWVGSTNFTICGSEFEHIEEFLAQCREAVPLLNAETLVSGRMNQEDQ